MASIPDLDEIERRIRQVGDEGDIDVAHDLVTLTMPKLVAELRTARKVSEAAPSVEHLRELVKWCDLIDKFASMVDEGYKLPRDEIQRDLTALADALEQYASWS